MLPMRMSAAAWSGARRRWGRRAGVTVLAAVAVAAGVALLAGCRVTLVAPVTAVKNPFVGTWTAEVPGQSVTYRFDANYRFERESTAASGGTSIGVSISGTYAYEPRTAILTLTPTVAAIAREQFKYEFPKRDTLVLTTYPRGALNVTYTFRRET